MGNEPSILDFIETCYPDRLPQEIVFYGGSFNPWHDGHREALKKLSHKHVIVIPDRNPLKAINPFSLKESEERILSDLSHGQFLYSGFLSMRTHNPTQVWMNKIRNRYPELQIGLLMGFDNFSILDRWYEAEQLVKDLDRIYVLSRNDNDVIKGRQCEKLNGIKRELELVFLGNHAYEDMSSTRIREHQLIMTEESITAAI